MGICYNKEDDVVVMNEYDPQHKYRDISISFELRQLIEKWNLSVTDLKFLHERFLSIDIDNSGAIDIDEFFGFMHEKRNLLMENLFPVIAGNQRELDFGGWLSAVFGFCLLSRDELLEQIFIAYDENEDGILNLGELHHLLVSIHGTNPIFPEQIVNDLTALALDNDGSITFELFTYADKIYPMLMWPVFRMQHGMRKRTLGLDFFKVLERRLINEAIDPRIETQRRKWRQRKDTFLLYCCSWPCCIDQNENIPSSLEEIRRRKINVRRMHIGNMKRTLQGNDEFNPLPMRTYHTDADHQLEKEIMQVHTIPLKDEDLVAEPMTLAAIDDNGSEYSLSVSDDSVRSLLEVEEDEFLNEIYTVEDEI